MSPKSTNEWSQPDGGLAAKISYPGVDPVLTQARWQPIPNPNPNPTPTLTKRWGNLLFEPLGRGLSWLLPQRPSSITPGNGGTLGIRLTSRTPEWVPLTLPILPLTLLVLFAGGVQPLGAAPVVGANGMVVAAHPLATQVGVEVLRRGGNAVDAAVAVGYALAVVYPSAGNLGGGGFLTLRFADGRATFLDFRETAPLAATEGMYLDAAGNPTPERSTRGHLAAGVPGSLAGLELARERYGTLSRPSLIEPALRLAEEGFVLAQGDVDLLERARADFRDDPPAAAIFLKGGQPWRPGDTLVQKALGATLRLVAAQGAEAFYRGPIATEIVRASREGGGILSLDDFSAYRVRELEPIRCRYRGFDILSAPPPSSGGTTLCLLLQVLEGYPLGGWGFQSATSVHYLSEALRRAFVDRNSLLGDPDFVSIPLQRLLSPAYAESLRGTIQADQATPSATLGGPAVPREPPQTTHFSVIDGAGNAVAVTTTLNGAFGARVVAGGTGILLNNEMDDFSVRPGTPNRYGLVQGHANAIAPGKRPLSSMTPTLVTREGQPVLVIGSPGGPRIITTVLQVILNLVDHGMTLEAAIAAPRIHHQWLPDRLFLEPDALSPEVRVALARMGHSIEEDQPWGDAAGILVGGPALGSPSGLPEMRFFGVADPRAALATAGGY